MFLESVLVVLIGLLLIQVIRVARTFLEIKKYANYQINLENLLIQKNKQSTLLNNLYAYAYIYQSREARINQLLDEIFSVLEWKILSYWELDEKEQVLRMKYQRGLPQQYLDMLLKVFNNQVKVGGFGTGRAVTTKQPVIINNWEKDPDFKDLKFLSESGDVRSFAAFPVATNKRIYGNLHFYGNKMNQFKLNEAQLFTTITNSFAAILENDELATVEGGDSHEINA